MRYLLTKNKFYLASIFLMLLFYIWIAVQIPYTHDDWDWGLQLGMKHLLTADINSRYMGNLIEVILTRSTILKTFVMGIVFTLIPMTITIFTCKLLILNEENADLIRAMLFMFSNLMIMLLPKDIWRQTNGWIAGFSNFVVSSLALLSYFIFIIGFDSETKESKKTKKNNIGLFFFGIAIQLFLENLSIFFFLFSSFFLIAYRKEKDIFREIAPLFLGNLIGLMIMFSSNIYSSLWNTGYAIGTYRHLMYDPTRPLHAFILESGLRYLKEFIPQIVSHNGILMGYIAIMMAFNMIKKKELFYSVLCGINIVFCVYYVYSYFKRNPFLDILHNFGTISTFVTTLLDCTFVVLMIIETVILFKTNKRFLSWFIVVWLSPFIIIAPMIMINTVGPRSFYTTDICFILIGSIIFSSIVSHRPKNVMVVMSVLFLTAMTSLCIRWIKIYEPIGKHSRERERIIENTITNGGNHISFSQYPNSDYLWFPDPIETDSWRVSWFKEFYHIPDNIDIWFDSWNK